MVQKIPKCDVCKSFENIRGQVFLIKIYASKYLEKIKYIFKFLVKGEFKNFLVFILMETEASLCKFRFIVEQLNKI